MTKKSWGGMTAVGAIFALLLVTSAAAQTAQAAITTQMDLGSRSNDVTALQQFLATNSQIYPQGLITGFFGPMTQAAVVQFQVSYDIPQAGRVGPMTEAKINSIMASGLGLDTSAPIMANASLQIGRTGATVGWTTNENAQGQVYYDTSPIQSSEATAHQQQPYVSGVSALNNTGSNSSESVAIQNLQPNTVYYYLTRSVDNSGNVSMTLPGTFRTNQ